MASIALAKLTADYQLGSSVVARSSALRKKMLWESLSPVERCLFDHHLRPGWTIDMGAGAGRVISGLADRAGHHFVAVECCPEFAEGLRQNEATEQVVECSMQERAVLIPRLAGQKFDNIICLGGAICGLFSAAEQMSFARICAEIANDGARLFIDTYVWPDWLGQHSKAFDLVGVETDSSAKYRGKGYYFSWTVDGETVIIPQYAPSGDELVAIFEAVGFRQIDGVIQAKRKDEHSKISLVFQFDADMCLVAVDSAKTS